MFLYSMTQSLICDFNFGFDFDYDFVFCFGFDFDFGLHSLPTSVQENTGTLAHLSLYPSADAAALSHLTLRADSVACHYERLRPNVFS